MPVPPRWVEELLGCSAPGDARNVGVDVHISGSAAHATMRIHDAVHLEAAALRQRGRGRVSRRHRVTRDNRPTSRAVLELHPRHRRADGRRARSLHGIQCRPPRRVQAINAARCGTASAVGIKGSDLSIHCLALEEPGTPVENPRQTPAWQYSARYGPLPPCFSRATIVDLAGRRTLLIGGTASVVGEDSRHAGQFDAQVEETLLNLEALIRATNASRLAAARRFIDWSTCASMSGRPRTPNASASCSSTAALAREPSPSPSRKSAGLSYWWKWKVLRNSNRRV